MRPSDSDYSQQDGRMRGRQLEMRSSGSYNSQKDGASVNGRAASDGVSFSPKRWESVGRGVEVNLGAARGRGFGLCEVLAEAVRGAYRSLTDSLDFRALFERIPTWVEKDDLD